MKDYHYFPFYDRKLDNSWGIGFIRKELNNLTPKEKEFYDKVKHLNRVNEEDAAEYRKHFIDYAGPYPED